MIRESGNGNKRGTFGTNISFDIDDAPSPQRRKQRTKREPTAEIGAELNACPGCGAEIDHEHWTDCLVGFVAGAKEFELGNPVRARIVQNLRNEVSKMNLPNPRNNWELAIADKLINEISKIVSAEVNRAKSELTASGSISAVEREQIIRETEELTINNYALEIQDSLIEQLTPQLEVKIRHEVENELWQVFEEEWRNRTMKE